MTNSAGNCRIQGISPFNQHSVGQADSQTYLDPISNLIRYRIPTWWEILIPPEGISLVIVQQIIVICFITFLTFIRPTSRTFTIFSFVRDLVWSGDKVTCKIGDVANIDNKTFYYGLEWWDNT